MNPLRRHQFPAFKIFCVLFFFYVQIFGNEYGRSIFFKSNTGNRNVPLDEINALYDFYNNFHGTGWYWRPVSIYGSKWNFTGYPNINPCQENWQGISCANLTMSTATITAIELNNYNLTGIDFPTSITNLTQLENLLLNLNSINSTIPSFLCDLKNLTILQLTNSSIRGRIPSCLFQDLPNLKLFSAMNNSLTGSLPSFTKPVQTQLSYLFLMQNYLTGYLPSSLQYLSQLQYLYLGFNHLKGPIDVLFPLTNLRRLALNNNFLTSSLPVALNQSTQLQYLYLHENFFSGSLPSSIGALTELIYFAVSSNLLTGTLPESLINCNYITTLTVSDNYFRGTYPSFLASWTELTQLSLYSNYFSGVLPANAFNNFPNLTLLLLEENCFSGSLQSNQLNTTVLSKLVSLDISDNYFTGNLPLSLLSSRSALQVLTGFKQCFTTSIPPEICQLQHLQILDLDGMTSNCAYSFWPGISSSPKYARNIPGGIPDCLWSLTNLTTFRLSGNGFSGTIPSLTVYGNLTAVDISYNYLSGTIPIGLQQWKLLQELNLENNKLVGNIESMSNYHFQTTAITDDFNNIYGLRHGNDTGIVLSLAQNRLSGTIPTEMESAQSINILNGNLFACTPSEPPPYHDPNNQNYVCGSNLLDYSLYLFVAVGSVLLLLLLLLFLFLRFLQVFSQTLSQEARFMLGQHPSNRWPSVFTRNTTAQGSGRDSLEESPDESREEETFFERIYSYYQFLLKVNNHREMKRIFHKYRELKLYYAEEKGEGEEEKQEEKQKEATAADKANNRMSKKRGTAHSDRADAASTFAEQLSLYQRCKRSIIIVVLKVLMWRSKVTSMMSSYEKEQQLSLEMASETDRSMSHVTHSSGFTSTIRNKEIRYLYQFLKSLQTLRRISLLLMLSIVLITSPVFYGLKQYYRTYTTQYRWLVSGVFFSGPYPAMFIIIVWFIALFVTFWMLAKYIPKFDESSAHIKEKPNADEQEEEEEGGGDAKTAVHVDTLVDAMKGPKEQRINDEIDEESGEGSRKQSRKLSHTGALVSTITQSDSAKLLTNQLASTVSTLKRFSFWISVCSLLFNAVVVIVMKTTFIFLLISSNTTFTEKVFTELSLSAVDVLWGSVVLPYFISNLPKLSSNTKMVLKTSMLYFNSILVPIVILTFVDPSCFYGLFVSNPSVTENFNFESCLVNSQIAQANATYYYTNSGNVTLPQDYCFAYVQYTSSISFVPFFTYTYNCYSSILTSYIPIFLISYLVLTIAIPSVTFFILSRQRSYRIMKLFPRLFFIETDNERALRYFHYRQRKVTLPYDQEGEGGEKGRGSEGGWRNKEEIITGLGPAAYVAANPAKRTSQDAVLSLLRSDSVRSEHHYQQQRTSARLSGTAGSEIDEGEFRPYSIDSLRPSYGAESMVIRTELYDAEIPHSFQFFKKTVFYPEFILAAAVHHILVMITFGIMSPPLMIVAGLLTTVTSLLWETLLGRWMMRDETYLGDSIDEKFAGPYTTKLDELCIHVCRSPRKCLFLLAFGSGGFIGLVVMDMIGDQVGWYQALWAPLLVMGLAFLLFSYFNYGVNIYADHSAFEKNPAQGGRFGRPTSSASVAAPAEEERGVDLTTVRNPVLASNRPAAMTRSKSDDLAKKKLAMGLGLGLSPQDSFEQREKRRAQSHKLTLDQIKLIRRHQELLDDDFSPPPPSSPTKTPQRLSRNPGSPLRPSRKPVTSSPPTLSKGSQGTQTQTQTVNVNPFQRLKERVAGAQQTTRHSSSEDPFLEMTSIYGPNQPKDT